MATDSSILVWRIPWTEEPGELLSTGLQRVGRAWACTRTPRSEIAGSYGSKEDREKVGLKLNIQKTKIMASGPITSWEIDGETVQTVSDFIFLDSKVTADGDCSH